MTVGDGEGRDDDRKRYEDDRRDDLAEQCCALGQITESRRARAIEPLAHFLAGLEERHALLIDGYMGAGARIAAGARRTLLHRERAEAAQLDAVAAPMAATISL